MEDHADGIVKGVILVQPHVRHLGLVTTGLFVLWSQRQASSLTQSYCRAFLLIQGSLIIVWVFLQTQMQVLRQFYQCPGTSVPNTAHFVLVCL